MKSLSLLAAGAAFGMALAVPASAEDTPGNRYNLMPRLYHSEVSVSEAYLLTNHDRGNVAKNDFANAVLIDVRTIAEYVAGHPPGAYSIPFPHIAGSPSEPNDATDYIGYDVSVDPDVSMGAVNDGTLPIASFVEYVEALFPDRNTPILTLCRTGHRSVMAGNALAKAGYTNVRNIWEGYVGQLKYAYAGGTVADPLVALDLNNDGAFDDRDKDGWAGFANLPVSTKLHPERIFSPYADLYTQ